MAARVPAWKRLGLKLGGSDQPPAPVSAPSLAASSTNGTTASPAPKRKASSGTPSSEPQAAKKSKKDNYAAPESTPSKKAKAVSFASETSVKEFSKDSAAQDVPGKDIIRNKQKQKQQPPAPKKSTAKSSGPAPPVNLGPSLEYLRKWHSDRDSWKFNKNHQTKLLEQVFADETTIPAADIDIFYEYIRPLKGHVRQRLQELANGVKSRDAETGAAAFTHTKKKDAENKQQEYERVVQEYMAKEKPATGGKPRFAEVDYVLRTADMEMQRRVVKRMRAQNVLDELDNNDDSAPAAADTNDAVEKAAAATRTSITDDASKQRSKRKNRKSRTANVTDEYDESSSDSSDSDSDSGSDDEKKKKEGNRSAAVKAAAKAKDDFSSSSDSDSSSDSSDSNSDSD